MKGKIKYFSRPNLSQYTSICYEWDKVKQFVIYIGKSLKLFKWENIFMKLSLRSTYFESFSLAVLSLDWLGLSPNHFDCGETASQVNEHLEENKYRELSVH